MATVTGTLRLNDKMTPALKSVVAAINSTLSVMEHMDVASSSAFRSAQRDAAMATSAVNNFTGELAETPAAARAAEGGMQRLLSKALSLGAVLYGLRAAVAGVGSITGLSDSMSRSLSRLNQINDGCRTTLEYQDMIFRSADRARSNYLDTVDAVTKFGANSGDAFSGTEEIVAFTELMNKSFKLAGAGAEEQSGAMRQLSQAMAAGVLRGDEFNSIAEQAPEVYKAIAHYLGMSKGEVRELAAEGGITATIVKNAMFTAAEAIENRFGETPLTVADHMARMQNAALRAFGPVLERINEIAQGERFARFTQDISSFFYTAAGYALDFMDTIAQVGAFVQDNGDAIVVCIGAIAAALVLLNAKTVVAGVIAAKTAIMSAAAWIAAAWPILLIIGLLASLVIAYQNTSGAVQAFIGIIGVLLLAYVAWEALQLALNAAQAANPIGAVIMAIIILIGVVIAIIAWIRDLWQTNLDFKYGLLSIWDSIVFFFKGIPLFFQKVGYGIADAFSYAKVTVLNILQNMANGAINIVNNLIALLNKIPGVAIDPIEQLTFATTIAAEEEAHRQARAGSLAQAESTLAAEKNARQTERNINRMTDQVAMIAKSAADNNKKSAAEQAADGIDYSKYLSENAPTGGGVGGGGAGGGGNLGNIGKVGSVGKIDNDITISDEDIKLLKDIATMEYQLRYTQLTPQMHVTFGDIRETADANKILEFVESSLEEALSASLYVEVNG